MSMQPTSNAAGRDGSALRMLKLFRDRPLAQPVFFVSAKRVRDLRQEYLDLF
ncbi:MAG: hypothetical protein V1736_05050 [Pseudomonadota bacterium]